MNIFNILKFIGEKHKEYQIRPKNNLYQIGEDFYGYERFIDEKGNRIGYWQVYSDDGESFTSIGYGYEDNKTSDGLVKRYSSDGKLESIVTLKKGSMDGPCEIYTDGFIEAKGYYLKGVHQGKWEYFDENGDVDLIGFYSDGWRDGEWKYFHKGRVYKIETYQRGRLLDTREIEN